VHLFGLIIEKFVTMHGHTNVKLVNLVLMNTHHPNSKLVVETLMGFIANNVKIVWRQRVGAT
jgi:hypothetical protein